MDNRVDCIGSIGRQIRWPGFSGRHSVLGFGEAEHNVATAMVCERNKLLCERRLVFGVAHYVKPPLQLDLKRLPWLAQEVCYAADMIFTVRHDEQV